jgi:ATP-dependent protease HslVU (ClpYQ) peptidase subunit
MGCDSAISSETETQVLSNSKIIKKGEMLIGVTGSMRGLQLLEYSWIFPEQPKEMSDTEYIYSYITTSIKEVFFEHQYCVTLNAQENQEDQFLIGYKGKLYLLDTNYQIFELDSKYVSIGSGSSFSYGSLKTQEDIGLLGKDSEMNITRAINTAIEFSIGVKGPIRIFKV